MQAQTRIECLIPVNCFEGRKRKEKGKEVERNEVGRGHLLGAGETESQSFLEDWRHPPGSPCPASAAFA